MFHRLNLSDWRSIGHYLGVLVLITSASMVPMMLFGLALEEYDAAVDFLFSIGICASLGSLLMLCRVEQGTLDWRQSLVITGLVWVVISAAGAIPLYLSGCYLSFLDAFFDAVSACTTTGLTLVVDVDHMAGCVVMWRSALSLMGCIGVIVIALALGIFGTGAVASTLYHAEGREGRVMPEIKQTSRFILVLAAVIVGIGTLACLIPMLVSGMPVADALVNAFIVTVSSFSTGGMVNHSLGIMYYHSWPLEVMTIVLAAFGCINFVLFGDLWRGNLKGFFKDLELRTLAVWGLLLALLLAFALVGNQYFDSLGAELRRGLYVLLSGLFNVGLSTMYPAQALYTFGAGALFITILAMLICGSTSSASGGIKALRIGIIARSVAQTIRETLAPGRAHPRTFYYHHGRHLLSPELVSSAMIILLLYLATYAIGAIVGIGYGYDVIPAIFDSVSAASNTGLSAGVVSTGMPVGLEILYIFEMWLGRLEFIAFFAMLVEVFSFLVPRKRTFLLKRKSGR